MTHRTLQAVLRKLADAGPPAADADLLRRFVTERDETAFALLVQRHGRLVWAVCRHLTRSDAEADDAFQATFLVLIRNAGKVRDAGKLSAWLHGVAYRVCSKARQSAKRRTTREAMTAKPERNGVAVPDSAWDRALAAVHEEVAKLPDTLRAPFVLCCLEGKGQTEAAEQLGWKLGTLSGRLTRAKDAVLARLDARGLTLGAVAAVGLTVPPSTVMAKAAALVRAGVAVPGSILQLSHGVIGMSVNQVKLLAAGLLVACGLGVSGTAWVASAGAQTAPNKESAEQRVKRLEAELAKAKREASDAQAKSATEDLVAVLNAELTRMSAESKRIDDLVKKNPADTAKWQTNKWQYDFVVVSEMGPGKFVAFLHQREVDGWDYAGLTQQMHDGKMTPIWVFRKPLKPVTPLALSDYRAKPLGETVKAADAAKLYGVFTQPPPKVDEAAALAADIKKLQVRLAEIKVKEAKDAGKAWVEIDLSTGKLDPETAGRFLNVLLTQKFGSGAAQILVVKLGLRVFGTKEVTDFAQGTVKMLTDK